MGASIEVTFLWRLLFDYFLRGRTSFEVFMGRMMAKDRLPTLRIVLDLIAESHGDSVTKKCPLRLFLGVDEYQAVNALEGVAPGEASYTRRLATMIGAYMAEPCDKVILLPMFAGIDLTLHLEQFRIRHVLIQSAFR
jgi:hypothetical protein